jgi:hypothetical protein
MVNGELKFEVFYGAQYNVYYQLKNDSYVL